ncbi:MAG: hypothetical protein ABI947_15385 [Chloroflexota bacterium]
MPSWQSVRARLTLALIALAYLAIFPGDTPAGNSLNERVLGSAKEVLFNYVAWEANAISRKFDQQQAGLSAYLTEPQRSRYVVDYLQAVHQLQDLDGKINGIYTDPKIPDHEAATVDLRTQRTTLQNEVNAKLPLAEAIIEEQISSVLRDEGLATLGAVLPPVSAHITELPMLLVISPRDQIKFETSINVVNMKVDDMDTLENSIDHRLDVSSLVVPIGGLSLYPSMVEQTWYAPFVFEVAAHEWTHHYLYFFPLGLNYNESNDTRTINETTASFMGKEIARKTLLRFYSDYPDLIAQLPPLTPPQTTPTPPPNPATPPPFDFDATMNEIRVNVDRLLAAGKIDEAERYMAAQRLVFAQNGYAGSVRKLNQAYFAFYGGYLSAGSSGAGGTDPTGSAISEIRKNSPSVKAWLETMRSIMTRDQLLAARDTLRKSS